MLYTATLLLLLILNHQGLVTADPIADHQGTLEQDDWCDNPSTIHRRLDTIQEQLEKTVDHLDSEVKSLLNDVSETAWTKPLAPGIPLVDLFGDPS
ncbi:placenta-specific protein 9 isoform X1 [Python bivittatus]|uniref:Placenta-specific protein 9 isoform X1 n=1 Tax=Python bivittatus TaxID=176946 RepID=A0A9F2QY43_PYTBI|nr:placenta-specific protein 9 isoform X1 [Python bivittatus]XP_007430229.1 placenta-specific protein 9 isoform X1 [Python bivittatus]